MHRRHFLRATSATLALARVGVLAIASDVIHSVFAASAPASGADPFPLRVSVNGRHLVTQGGKPWLYHADTGWQVFSKLTLAEADEYFADRAAVGFTAIQTQLVPPSPKGRSRMGQTGLGSPLSVMPTTLPP